MAELIIRGRVVLLDDDDMDRVSQYRWHISSSGAVRRSEHIGRPNPPRMVYLHRWLLDAPSGFDVDHINGNRLDNRRANLRIATRSQNQQNTRRFRRNRTGFKGVYWKVEPTRRAGGSYCAAVSVNGKRVTQPGFKTAEEAAHEYDRLARLYYGEFAALNFDAAMTPEPKDASA